MSSNMRFLHKCDVIFMKLALWYTILCIVLHCGSIDGHDQNTVIECIGVFFEFGTFSILTTPEEVTSL